ncbi:MAG: hypothetical protein GC161_12330 [Planctomycetaceae bacterium]|nr:hypothetical protein [Planctomycetaceae bacterium]
MEQVSGGQGDGAGGGQPWRKAPDESLELRGGAYAGAPAAAIAHGIGQVGESEQPAPASRGLAPADGSAERDPAVERRWTRAARALVALVLVLLVHGAWRVGPTYDEHFYIAAGRGYLHTPDFGLNREHPPLLKYMAGLPLLVLGVDPRPTWRDEIAFPSSLIYARERADLDRNLFAARLPFCLLSAFFVWWIFRVGRAWFGARAGFVGAALLGLNPNWLAHGRLAGLDAGTAVFVAMALVAFVLALERPTARRTLFAAVLFGLANLAKFTGLLLGPACIALAALAAVWRRNASPLLVLARVLLGGLGVFALGYGLEVRSIHEAWGEPSYPVAVARPELERGELAAALDSALRAFEPLPADALSLRQELARAPSEDVALAAVLARVAAPTPIAVALLETLEVLDGKAGELRKRAVGALLEPASGALPEPERLELVSKLAERDTDFGAGGDAELALERWRAWYDRARSDDWNETIFVPGIFERLTRGVLGDRTPIPLLTALKGIDYQLYHGRFGHGSYFKGVPLQAGRDFQDGNPFPEYYAVVMGVKNPLAFLAAAGLGLLLALVTPRRFGSLRLAACVLFPLACFYLFSTGNALMGVRYVLPIFPFLALFAARFAASLPKVGLALVLVAAGESLWIHPHELMYYNTTVGGPGGGPELTPVGDDWGQDVRLVGEFSNRHRDALRAAGGLVYEPYNVGDPAAFGLLETRLPKGRERAVIAVHVLHYWREREKWSWLDAYEPFHHLGHSVLLFDTRAGPPGRDPGLR